MAANASLSRSRFLFVALFLAMVGTLGVSVMQGVRIVREAPPAVRVAPAQAAPLPTMQAIGRMGWFGVPPEEMAESGDAFPQLELKGISRAPDAKLAGAYIAEKGKPEAYFRIGDALPANAGTLTAVFDDRVTINNGAASGTLRFDADNKKK